jgi:cysteine-rich repeat protein
VVLVVVACAGCYRDQYITCGPVICPSTMVCSQDQTCVTPEQIAACTGAQQGAACSFGASHGFCHDAACVATLDICGDGVQTVALGELCDCGTGQYLLAPPAGCNGFNADTPGATCRSDCRPARCGDAIVDPGEQCDDGNNVSGDGCAGDCLGRFEKMQTPTARDLSAVWMLSPTDVYVTGFDTPLHYDGSSWLALPFPVINQSMRGVYASSTSDVWAVGDRGEVVHYDGSQSREVSIGTTADLAAIWGSSATNIYVVGSLPGSGGVAAFHYDGTWTPVTLPSQCTVGVNGASAVVGVGADVYIGSQQGICHGTSPTLWSQLSTVDSFSLATDASHLYALGQAVLRTYRLPAGVPRSDIFPGALAAIGASSPDELIGVGPNGIVLQFQLSTTTWTHLVTPTELFLRAVVASSPQNVFIVGDAGTILH